MRFAQPASDYKPAENSDVVFIRTFKDAMTQIRIVPFSITNKDGVLVHGAQAWLRAREHYKAGVGSFPCNTANTSECIGHNDPDPDVKDASTKYYFNALDDQAVLRVYKFGVTLWKIFEGRQQRAYADKPENKQPLSDRDYVIIHTGTGKESSYDPEPGEKYPVEFPTELHDIDQILSDQYDAAEAAMMGTTAGDRQGPAKTTMSPTTRIGVKEVAKEDPWANGKATIPPDNSSRGSLDPETEWESWGAAPTEEQIDAADTPAIKAWLDAQEVEYPSRAPRLRLIEMAKAAAAPPF